MPSQTKRYLITGITGFTGPHLANELFSQGYDVAGLIRAKETEKDILDTVSKGRFERLRFFEGDITDYEGMARLFSKNKFEGVFHLAALSHPPTSYKEPRESFLVNALGTVNIVDAIERNQPTCKFMYCSTPEVYGRVRPEQFPMGDNTPLNPISPYAVGKAAADMYVRERALTRGLPFFVTRAFANTGPRRRENFSVASDAYQIARIKAGLQKPVVLVGNLESERPVIDVRDCVRAYRLLMENFTPGEVYNFGGTVSYSMGNLLERMLVIAELEDKVEIKSDPNLIRKIGLSKQVVDSTKVEKLTGWKPQIPIEKTLKDLLDYYNEQVQRGVK